MRIFDRLLVLVYVAIAALPVIAMTFDIRGRQLRGVLADVEPPALGWDAVRSERFQRATEAWFERYLGLRGMSISIDNAILYHGFHETKYGSELRIGVDGVLFNIEDINYYNRRTTELPAPAAIDRRADQIAAAQQRLRAQHRALVPILIPAKTFLWRDKIPTAWRLALGDPRPSDTGVYRAFKEALDRRRVAYIDMRDVFEAAQVPRDDLWLQGARHWSAYGACLALERTAALYAELTGKPRPAHDCVLGRGRGRPADDFDLLRLLNAMFVYRHIKQVPVVLHAPPPSGARPSAIFAGTSFSWTLVRDADASGLYRDLTLNYYNRTFIAWPSDRQSPIEPGTPAWRRVTMDRDLYVLDLFETYLAYPDTYLDEFLDQLLRELDQ